jgi:uncharacterized protein (DUF3820 family)/predicted RNA-binding Zn-ribbon protein involved in translation (DUF1610 family)
LSARSFQARRATAKADPCPDCGNSTLRLVRTEGTPHFGRYDCLTCGRIGPWIKSPWTLERARSFVMPFGKFRGRTVGDLADEKQGRSYLEWAAENVSGNAGTAAGIALGLINPESMEAAS